MTFDPERRAMTRRHAKVVRMLVMVLPWSLLADFSTAETAKEDDARLAIGKRIYLEGRASDDPAEEIKIGIGGDNAVEVPAWTLPCGTCHGADGRGGIAVQNVAPPDIRWEALMADLPSSATGRTRPAYTDHDALRKAITEGVDAGGTALSPVMPRFRLDDAQWEALVAYLETLRRE